MNEEAEITITKNYKIGNEYGGFKYRIEVRFPHKSEKFSSNSSTYWGAKHEARKGVKSLRKKFTQVIHLKESEL